MVRIDRVIFVADASSPPVERSVRTSDFIAGFAAVAAANAASNASPSIASMGSVSIDAPPLDRANAGASPAKTHTSGSTPRDEHGAASPSASAASNVATSQFVPAL